MLRPKIIPKLNATGGEIQPLKHKISARMKTIFVAKAID
jgi:hypothetical protein